MAKRKNGGETEADTKKLKQVLKAASSGAGARPKKKDAGIKRQDGKKSEHNNLNPSRNEMSLNP